NITGDSMAVAERIVLVDVAGAGGSGDGHFTLDDGSSGYRQIGATGAVEGGLYFYTLNYDAAAKQHALRPSAFSGKALELARIGRAASEPWRTATGMWRDRQVELRDSVVGESGGLAVWIKAAGNVVTQSGQDVLDLGAARFAYNMGSHQETIAI